MPEDALTCPAPLESFLDRGFLLAGVSDGMQAAIADAFDAARAFFGRDLAEKLIDRLPLDAGYRPYGVEYSSSNDHPDEMESFTFSGRTDPSDLGILTHAGRRLHSRMQAVFEHLLPSIASTTAALARGFGHHGLGGPAMASLGDWSILQLNHSRPSQVGAEFINDEHEDGCLLTAMVGTAPGLELRLNDGSYCAVLPSDGVVVAPGEILSLLSGGAVGPTYHRVRRIADVDERLSLLLFADLGPAYCDPWVVNDTNRNVDIADRMLRNSTRYGLDRWSMA